jgi:heme exporter protein C
MRKTWWKILCILLLAITIVAGFLGPVPAKPILHETIRNLYFHVAMWFGMMIFFTAAFIYSIRYLRSGKLQDDLYAVELTNTGILFGILGLLTGAIWAKYTWGKPWSNDIKQIGATIALLIYLAYLVLRNSLTDMDKRARIGAVYNIFAFFMLFPTIWIIPRLVDSLHPGGMGNPALDTKDIDARMRLVFWPAAIPGWTLLGWWITSLRIRVNYLMVKKVKYWLMGMAGLLLSAAAQAQAANDPPQMAEGLRSNGKIYVVVTVLLVILGGIALYLVRLDRKISSLEKGRD